MQKFIKVQKAPAKRGYIEAIRLTGNYLKAHGFEMGDSVKLTVQANRIIIETV